MRATRRSFFILLAVGLLGVVATAGRAHADERVDITATDGVQLIGRLAGTTGPGVVLVGKPDRDPRTWETAASAIAAHGFRVLRFDQRGHGESDGPADATAIDHDVEGAFRYLIGRKIRPVYLVAEGEGGPAVVRVAARVPAEGIVIVGDTTARPTLPARTRVATLTGDLTEGAVRDALVKFLHDPQGAATSAPTP